MVASQGGAPTHPSWFLNLVANPVVHLQVGSQRFTATARPVSGAERARLWKLLAGIWTYDEYQAKTDREIPVVVIERTD